MTCDTSLSHKHGPTGLQESMAQGRIPAGILGGLLLQLWNLEMLLNIGEKPIEAKDYNEDWKLFWRIKLQIFMLILELFHKDTTTGAW